MSTQIIDEDTLTARIAQVAEDAGVFAFAHARDIDTGAEVGFDSDAPTVTASVFKVPVLVEYVRQVSAGELDPAQRVRFLPADATLGPTGLSVFSDEAEWSLRDVATSMITVSDNAATDIVTGMVTVDRVNQTMRELGLPGTQLTGDCARIFEDIANDLAAAGIGAIDGMASVDYDTAAGFIAATPEKTNRTTPREATSLLQQIWTDAAASPEACAEARRILGLQVWPHRLSSGFPRDDVKISGKTGTLGMVRNEIGVVEFPDGTRHAIAVFLRGKTLQSRNPAADRAIGDIARLLSDALS
ncbi:serine hydrolase [Leucobacter komagatae]|uniref:serine hydrolase n=1 Tax=Leucobacter komagatae TaxID=55969 RepID=UPI0005AC1FF3|nr:serine hydrolase [Leucobacter komagatae]